MDARDREFVLEHNATNEPFEQPRTTVSYLAWVNPVEAGEPDTDPTRYQPSLVDVSFITQNRPFGTPRMAGPIRFTVEDLRRALRLLEGFARERPVPADWPPPNVSERVGQEAIVARHIQAIWSGVR